MRKYFLLALAAAMMMTQVAEARWFQGRLFNRRARIVTAAAPAAPAPAPVAPAPATVAPAPAPAPVAAPAPARAVSQARFSRGRLFNRRVRVAMAPAATVAPATTK
jgi:hypothetical protein